MKQRISRFGRLAGTVVVSAMLNVSVIYAADEAAPAQPTPPIQQQDAGRGNRAGRGDNAQDRRAVFSLGGGRGGFAGLNLDEKQNELLREAMQAESDELRKLSEKLQAAQKELVKAVIAEKYDDASVRQKADVVAKIQTEIAVLRAKAFATVSPTLKPEQRDQIENNRAASSIITGAGAFGGSFGGPPQDQFTQDRNSRRGDRGNNPGAGEPNQIRRRGGDRPGGQ
jgi:Spy/CpxP family protein refolding chaperone